MKAFRTLLFLSWVPLACMQVQTHKIGVLSAALQRDGYGANTTALEWGVENFNLAAEEYGHRLELVYFDWRLDYDTEAEDYLDYSQFQVNPSLAAQRMASDDSIVAVVGPFGSTPVIGIQNTSKKVDGAAKFMIDAKKPLVTTAGSANLMRYFGGSKGDYSIWRTRESDIAQAKAMVQEVSEDPSLPPGTKAKVAILAPHNSMYGETFFETLPFYATNKEMTITSIDRVNMVDKPEDIETKLVSFLNATPKPTHLLLVPVDDYTFALMCQTLYEYKKTHRSDTWKVLFSDGAFWPDVEYWAPQIFASLPKTQAIAYAHEIMQGHRGFMPVGGEGFQSAFYEKYGVIAGPDYDSSLYDAALLLGYGLAYSNFQNSTSLINGMKDAVDGRGKQVSWDSSGISEALHMIIKEKNTPDITGATGHLTFDKTEYTELAASDFAIWEIDEGQFHFIKTRTTDLDNPRIQSSAFFSKATEATKADTLGGPFSPSLSQQDTWALVIATSEGMSNYRHQADALAQYQMLKEKGIDDDHIVLIIADDLANHPDNPMPGVIINQEGGKNLNQNVTIDYNLIRDFSGTDAATKLRNILMGTITANTPDGKILKSTASDNMYVFIVGHGGKSGVVLHANTAEAGTSPSGTSSKITPEWFRDTLAALSTGSKFRRLFVSIESCHSGILGKYTLPQGVTLITAANPDESSYSYNFSATLGRPVADHYAFVSLQLLSDYIESYSMLDFYNIARRTVGLSHVMLYNAYNSGDLTGIDVAEFTTR